MPNKKFNEDNIPAFEKIPKKKKDWTKDKKPKKQDYSEERNRKRGLDE